jgi:hypothetical protein
VIDEREACHALRMLGGDVSGAASAHRVADEQRALPAQVLEHVDDVLRHARHRVVLARAPVGAAEAAHVDRDNFALGGQHLADFQPVVGEIRQAVHDQNRSLSPISQLSEKE